MIYGTDFFLERGRLSDEQALDILKMVQKDYNAGESSNHYELWQSMDDIYAGGKYHGEIILVVFRTYLNKAFNSYHNETMNVSGNWEIRNFAKSGSWAAEYPIDNTVLGSTGKRQYRFSFGYSYRVLHECPSGYYIYHIGGGDYEDWFRSSGEAKAYARSQIPSTEDIIKKSATTSSYNIRMALSHITNTVRAGDNIYENGQYDEVLLKIADQYVSTESKWGDDIAQALYQKLIPVLIEFANANDTKEALLQKAGVHNIQIEMDILRREENIF